MEIELMHDAKFSQSSMTSNYPYHISKSSDMEFSNGSATRIDQSLPQFQNPFILASASSNSFTGNPVQESSNVAATQNFRTASGLSFSNSLQKRRYTDRAMREMIFSIAMMQPIHIDPESVKPPKRRNVRISRDPQSVAARHRRERISEKLRILQRLVPGGTKMDTASMLDEAAHYLKFLKQQVQSLEQTANKSRPFNNAGIPMRMATSAMNYANLLKACQHQNAHLVGSMQMLS